MQDRSNVRCYLPKSEATKLLIVIEQIATALEMIAAASTKNADGYNAYDDVEKSFEEAYRAVRERMAKGGPGWTPKP